MAVTYSRYKFVTVSLPKLFRNGRFTSEIAVRITSETVSFHKTALDPEVLKKIRWGF
jgi:hypothetical protein